MSESHVQNAMVLHCTLLAVVFPTFVGLNFCPAQILVPNGDLHSAATKVCRAGRLQISCFSNVLTNACETQHNSVLSVRIPSLLPTLEQKCTVMASTCEPLFLFYVTLCLYVTISLHFLCPWNCFFPKMGYIIK